MTNDMHCAAWENHAVLRAAADEVVGPMTRLRCETILPRGKQGRSALLRRLLYPFIGQVSPPCLHGTDGTMCDECAWRWAIR